MTTAVRRKEQHNNNKQQRIGLQPPLSQHRQRSDIVRAHRISRVSTSIAMLFLFFVLLLLSRQAQVVQAGIHVVGNGLNDGGSMGHVSFDVPPSPNDILYMAHIIDSTKGGGIALGSLKWETVADGEAIATTGTGAGMGQHEAKLDVVILRIPDGSGGKEGEVDCTATTDYCSKKWPELVGVGSPSKLHPQWCCTKNGKKSNACSMRDELIVNDKIFSGLHTQISIPRSGQATLSLPSTDSLLMVEEGGVYVMVVGNCDSHLSQMVHVEGVMGWITADGGESWKSNYPNAIEGMTGGEGDAVSKEVPVAIVSTLATQTTPPSPAHITPPITPPTPAPVTPPSPAPIAPPTPAPISPPTPPPISPPTPPPVTPPTPPPVAPPTPPPVPPPTLAPTIPPVAEVDLDNTDIINAIDYTSRESVVAETAGEEETMEELNVTQQYPLWMWGLILIGVACLCLLLMICFFCCCMCYQYGSTESHYYHYQTQGGGRMPPNDDDDFDDEEGGDRLKKEKDMVKMSISTAA